MSLVVRTVVTLGVIQLQLSEHCPIMVAYFTIAGVLRRCSDKLVQEPGKGGRPTHDSFTFHEARTSGISFASSDDYAIFCASSCLTADVVPDHKEAPFY
jgi:hypothetical protein